jgi:hypothetical protein
MNDDASTGDKPDPRVIAVAKALASEDSAVKDAPPGGWSYTAYLPEARKFIVAFDAVSRASKA